MPAATGADPPGRDEQARPVTAGERHAALDVLRGVAVLGILVMNVYAFAMPVPAYSNPLIMGGQEWYNLGVWFATHVVADQKFMTIFSMLFGAGTVLMWQRAMARGAESTGIHYRRLTWLLLIGVLHGYLLWYGDILFHYALIGMLVYPARRWQPATLIVVACLLLPVALFMNFASYRYVLFLEDEVDGIRAVEETGQPLSESQRATRDEWNEIEALLEPTEAFTREDLAAHRGSYAEIVAYRAPIVAGLQLDSTLLFMLWRVGGLMLLGMALLKLGVLTARAPAATYRRFVLVGYGAGLPLTLFSCIDLYAHGFDARYVLQRGDIANYVGSVFVALGHVGLVMRLVQRGLLRGSSERLAAVGRMAFSNYLLQSVVMTSVFYGYGIGLYGQVPRAAQMLLVTGMFAFQLAISPWWLRRFRFGPAEWLWRSLTYGRLQRMRL